MGLALEDPTPCEHKLPFLPLSSQVLSPLAKNLFHRAISESGVALIPGLVKKDSKAEAKVGLTLDCPYTMLCSAEVVRALSYHRVWLTSSENHSSEGG